MKKNPAAHLFLVELVFNLSIFAICALTCVALMIAAHTMDEQSKDLTRAVYLAQAAADEWKQGGTPAAEQEGYEVIVTPSEGENGLTMCDIFVSHKEKVVYTLRGVARR